MNLFSILPKNNNQKNDKTKERDFELSGVANYGKANIFGKLMVNKD